MKIINKILLILLLGLSTIQLFAQQDPQYSLYMFNPMGVNPAYAGSREVLSGVLIHRSQWVGLEGAPTTQAFSVNMPLSNKKMGVGLQVVNDLIGPRQTLYASANYAYRLKLGRGKLAFGLGAGIINYNYDWASIEYKDPNDAIPTTAAESVMVPTFDFGVYYNTNTFYTGIGFDHLNRAELNLTDSSNARTYSHLTATIGKAFNLKENLVLKTSILLRNSENAKDGTLDINAGLLFNQMFLFGLTVSSRKSLTGILEINISKNLRMGYAYEHNATELTKSAGTGSHEIFVGYDIGIFKSKVLSPRYF